MQLSHDYNLLILTKILLLRLQEEPELAVAHSGNGEKDVIDINILSAVLFLLLASAFLMLLYFYMSAWFLRVLVILFCIGGFEVQSQPSFWNVFFKLCIRSSLPLEIRTESWVHKFFVWNQLGWAFWMWFVWIVWWLSRVCRHVLCLFSTGNWHPVQDLISSLLCILQNQVGLLKFIVHGFHLLLECLLVIPVEKVIECHI